MARDEPGIVVHGHPEDAEVAALLIVLAGRAKTPEGGSGGRVRPAWAGAAGRYGGPLAPGPDAWRLSGLTR